MSYFSKQSRLGRKLIKAAKQGNVKEAEALLAQGADKDYRTHFSDTPLFNAAYHGPSEGHLAVLRLLLEKGAKIDLRNDGGYSALHGAANMGNVEAMKILLAAGADKSAKDGKDALYWARQSGAQAAIDLVAPKKAAVAAAPAVESASEVTLTRALGNRVMEEIFDFNAKERITLIRNGAGGPVEAVTREGFADVKDRARLREAFNAYLKKGGQAEEAEIFTDQLIKPRTAQPPGATP